MNTKNTFDTGLLTWVRSEIDQALDQADQALCAYTDSVTHGAGDLSRIHDCRLRLHEVHGAVAMVGLDGITQLTEALEQLMDAVERMLRPAGETTIDLAHRSLRAIRQTFDALQAGKPLQALRLAPLYEAVQKARGIDTVSPTELFFPDTSLCLPACEQVSKQAGEALAADERRSRQKQARARFQKGLLVWLRAPQERTGLDEMREALLQIEASQETPATRTFWRVAAGVPTALTENPGLAESALKPWCTQIDQQLRRLIDGDVAADTRLLRESLYLIASSAAAHPLTEEIRTTYRLGDLIPDNANDALEETPQQQLHALLIAAENAWKAHCTGTASALTTFGARIGSAATLIETLGHTDTRRLAQAIVAAANWLGEDPARHSDTLAGEMATALLLADTALRNFAHLGSDFAQAVDTTVARLHRCIAGFAPADEESDPALATLSQEAQESLRAGQAGKALRNALTQIELVLDEVFRTPERRNDIATLETSLQQGARALTDFCHDAAALDAWQRCAADLRRLGAADAPAPDADFERIARGLALIGFFVDAREHDDIDFAEFARQFDAATPAAAPEAAPDTAASTTTDAEFIALFVEEARGELVTLADCLERLRRQAGDREALITLRRAFHTLKGSGRMVGLEDAGDAGWALEQTLNLWLGQERAVSPALLDLIEQARALFETMADALESQAGTPPDISALIAAAAALRQPPTDTAAPRPAAASRTILSGALLEIFRDEATGHVRTLRHELGVLERDETTATPAEMIRAAHTLAGISATVGFRQLNQLARALEYALLRRGPSAESASLEALGVLRQATDEIEQTLTAVIEQREISLSPDIVDALNALYPAVADSDAPAENDDAAIPAPAPAAEGSGKTKLATLVAALPQREDDIDPQLLPIFIDEAQELSQGIATQLRAWQDAPDDAEVVTALTRLLHTLKGSARMAGAMNLGEITHAIEARVIDTTSGGEISRDAIDDICNVFDDVQQILDRLQGGEIPDAGTPPPGTEDGTPDATPAVQEHEAGIGVPRATVRVRADLIDRLVNEAGELSIARTRIEGEMRGLKDSLLDLTDNVARLRRQLRDIEMQAETQMPAGQRLDDSADDSTPAGFDPLEFDRFTQFQEATRMLAESVNDVATVQQSLLKNLDNANAALAAQARLNRTLQNELMAVRMVPFGSLSDRLYRIVRQTSKELDKRVNLEIHGAQVELDRSVLDKMVAPLEHLLRNAVAHGLEAVGQRRAAGKPDIGEINLSLTQESNEVVLSLSDDGRGLDLPRIRARAVAAGLLAEDAVVSDDRLAEMIFTPGFSTAAEVSQIAGRGIGMDVVKNEVAHLGGRVDIATQAGKGTEFRLTLPLTLATTKALLVRVGNRRYAIPSAMIEQVLDLKEEALEDIGAAGQADWQGQAYPFQFLPRLLGDASALPERRRQYWVLLLRSGGRRSAVQVDELMGTREIVIKNVGPQLARVIGIEGATVLGGGEIVLIINPVALFVQFTQSPARGDAAQTPAAGPSGSMPAHRPTVMVVDDSLTVRKITGRMLAREGYQVLVARDGVDALEQLIDIVPDVLLVDIEMPRLDGFELTRQIRADERLHAVPIIMISSRTAEKHRRYAADIGVDHFLGKPFNEENLLKLVASFVTLANRS
ncbi:Hpt domain-containing protein [Propionivibrio dicarboxylicus]|uniref:Chemotaxis protein CheA n=1 Tax=Propionivibrio dicarboxylicus TaxID=83767 RepID=A0A1G7X1P1_9RHOO|nr:Hpt domain-containing protein [Propionivibrio dicarboxylicus]SDG77470.1 chemosensory pili system protein ChpA (sensor histidine kinase/response regulator) [Propionivibrio dicarboxylicus]